MLELKNIKIRSLAHFNYLHEKSKKTLILGASGSGKSSLLSVIEGSLSPEAGSIRNDFTRTSNIFQDLNLIIKLSAAENAKLVLTENQFTEFQQIAAELKMKDLDKTIETLSMGERQRISIAIALAQKAELVLADEPTSHLDPEMSMKVLDVILRHTDSLILVSHDHRFKTYFNSIVEIGAVS